MKNSTNKSNHKLIVILIIISALLVLVLAGAYLYTYLINEKHISVINTDRFYEGIYIDNINLGGMTKAEAKNTLDAQHKENDTDIYITIKWDETEEYLYTADDINVYYNTDEIIDKAYEIARTGSNLERYNEVTALQVNPVFFETSRQIDPSPIEEAVKSIAASKSTSSAEPSVMFNPDAKTPKEEWFVYSEAVYGVETDPESLWNSVSNAFINENFGTIDIPRWEVLPEVEIDYKEITQLIVSFKTVQSRDSNREHNIALACSMINGTVLLPGEEFSMNNTTGPRTKSAGFLDANTIVGGNELVPDVAGGVCQVSGTLFNAALMADLEITERYHHSYELGYLKRGRDATVNYGTLDLKFVNNHDYPIYIAMYTEIYGAPLTNCDHITIWVKTLKTIPIGDPIYVKDSEVPEGSDPVLLEGRTGITCEVYKIYQDENDKQISSVLSHKDIYKYYAPELHVNPADYERFTNPTAEPTVTPEPTDPDATPAPSTEPTATPVG